MGKITERDEEHRPSPQVLNGMGDAEWNGESSDHILRDEAILSSLLIPNTDQRRFSVLQERFSTGLRTHEQY